MTSTAAEFAERFAGKPTPPPAAVALKLDGPFGHSGAWKWIGRCPACAENGNDKKGEHLAVYADGRFACAAFKGDAGTQHRSRMAQLCPALRGGKGTGPVFVAPDLTAEREALKAAAAVLWEAIKSELSGDLDTLGKSARIDEDPRWQFATYLDSMFKPSDLVWVGHLYDASPVTIKKTPDGPEVRETKPHRLFSRHLFPAGDLSARAKMWDIAYQDRLDLTRGIAWKPGSISRHGNNVDAMRFAVVEHDDASKADQVALIRYVRDVLGWNLRMVIDTTGKSLHGLFDVSHLSPEMLSTHAVTLENMGVDPNALRQSATRCPGLIRQPNQNKPGSPSGEMQRIVWLA